MAVRFAKQAVVRGLDMPLQEGLELERRVAFANRLLDRAKSPVPSKEREDSSS
jgi:hypothetical protein